MTTSNLTPDELKFQLQYARERLAYYEQMVEEWRRCVEALRIQVEMLTVISEQDDVARQFWQTGETKK